MRPHISMGPSLHRHTNSTAKMPPPTFFWRQQATRIKFPQCLLRQLEMCTSSSHPDPYKWLTSSCWASQIGVWGSHHSLRGRRDSERQRKGGKTRPCDFPVGCYTYRQGGTHTVLHTGLTKPSAGLILRSNISQIIRARHKGCIHIETWKGQDTHLSSIISLA